MRPVSSSLHIAGLPASTDASAVQQSFGEDIALFRSLLGRMLQDYEDWTRPIEEVPEDVDAKSGIKARAHKLKGTAGMLGATDVRRFASGLEASVDQNRPRPVLKEIFNKLAAALNLVAGKAASSASWPNKLPMMICTTTSHAE